MELQVVYSLFFLFILVYSIQFSQVQIEVNTHPKVAKLIESGGSR